MPRARTRLRRVLGRRQQHELYHFIGKDIPYFHALFWPAMLSGASYRKPSGLFVHGHVTRRRAKDLEAPRQLHHGRRFREAKLDPDYLRYYYAAKLGSTTDDLDLNLADFVAKVNSDLVGKLVNIASRCAGFIHKLGGGRLAADAARARRSTPSSRRRPTILAADFEQREYSRAVRKIMALADRANQYIDERKPWMLAKKPDADAEIVGRLHARPELVPRIDRVFEADRAGAGRARRGAAGGRRAPLGRRRDAVARHDDRQVRGAADARRDRDVESFTKPATSEAPPVTKATDARRDPTARSTSRSSRRRSCASHASSKHRTSTAPTSC